MVSTVIGSVADKTDPKIIESKNESDNDPIPIADIIPTKILYKTKIININMYYYEMKKIFSKDDLIFTL